MNYVKYHLHTELSLLDSCTNFKLYVDKAKELGQTAIAFTEHGHTFNWIDKKMYCDKNGIKYIHGVEIYLTHKLEPKTRDNYHTILIAKNFDGVKEINSLIDLSTQPDHMYYKNRISFDEFLSISDNVIKISACLASPLNKIEEEIERLNKNAELIEIQYVERQSKEDYERFIDDIDSEFHTKIKEIHDNIESLKKYYVELLNKYDYFEIQHHISAEQSEYNKKLYSLSKQYNKPLIAGTDTHSLNKYKAECRSILQKAKKIEYASEDEYDLTYKSYAELVEMYIAQNSLPESVFLEAINNTNVMADSVQDFELDFSFKYPILYENDEDVFKKLISEKFKHKVKNGIINQEHIHAYKKAIVEEFKVFKKLDMIGFMLFMSELLTWCRENNIPYGYCRGSVGGSRLAYILDIIDLDPEVWKTVFSRFANEHRKEIGDIDVDFAPSQRQLVYDHIIERFGQDKTAYILAIGTISDKGTIDEIGRALSFKWVDNKSKHDKRIQELNSEYEHYKELNDHIGMDSISKHLSESIDKLYQSNDNPYSIEVISKIKSDYDLNPEQTKKENPELFYYFDGLLGTAISQSMHPAGIVASPVTLPDNYGTVWKDGKHILSINMEEIHEVSLVKYDILGLKNIEIIKDCREMAGLKYPLSYQINWSDKNIWSDITTSNVGIFQFEGQYAFKLLKDYSPAQVNDMSLINAALRPSGESYRDRLIAGEINVNPSEQIDNLLSENNGFLVFQEDTTKFLQDICGFSGSDADNVRRAIGRKDKDRLDKALPQILDGYCDKSDKPREIAEQEAMAFLKIIEDSSNYQFGYNHSTGYSMIGYTCAHDRYYYSLEFIAAYLNNANNEDDIRMGTELAKQKNIGIKPIKFRYSLSKYRPDKPTNSIYKGLESVKFLNSQIADELFELGKNQYNTFTDLLVDIKQTSVNSRQLQILTMLNFFSEFGKSRKLLNVIDVFDKLYGRKQLKLSELSNYIVDEKIILKHSQTQTEKMLKDIDTHAIINEYESMLEDTALNLKERLNCEKEFMGYIDFIHPKANKNIYYVTDFKVYKDKTKPYVDLYHVKTGATIKAKVTSGQVFTEKPFKLGDILTIDSFVKRPKTKQVNGKWEKSNTEFDNIIDQYDVY